MGYLFTSIASLGEKGLSAIYTLGRSGIFLIQALLPTDRTGAGTRLIIPQIFHVGVSSLVIILVSGLFIGMVLGLQGYTILSDYGSEQAVGQMVALTLVRELGAVVTALLFAGRAGSALTAEIGLMKATEQLASMEMIGVDPLRRIVAPRFWAGFISMPLLAMIFVMVGVWGGAVVTVGWLGVFDGYYWGNMQASVDLYADVLNGVVIKSIAFGFVVTWIAVFQGYDLVPTSEGIAKATTRTVVYSSLAILGIDFLLTALMFGEA